VAVDYPTAKLATNSGAGDPSAVTVKIKAEDIAAFYGNTYPRLAQGEAIIALIRSLSTYHPRIAEQTR
jgi:hypothetical protein